MEENIREIIPEDNISSYNKGFKKGMMTMALVALLCVVVTGIILSIYVGSKSEDPGSEETAAASETEELSESIYEGVLTEQTRTKMENIQSMIDAYYLFEQDPAWIEDGIYAGMVAGLGDPYSVYYNEEQFAQLMESTEGTYCGIGIMVSQDLNTGVISIVKVFQNTPGEGAGLQPEDMIVSVDGTEISGMDLDLVVSRYVKGEEGTPVTITVYRPSTGEYMDMTMDRQIVETPTVEYRMLDDGIGYIIISQFDMVTPDQFKLAVEDLQSQDMDKLIVDLRGNPGGVLDAVVSVMDYLLPDHIACYARTGDFTSLIYTEDKNGNGESYSAGDGHELTIPMAVLVNGDSASAAEVFAGTMQDYGWATVVGTTTFGKGIVQNLFPLGDGTGVKLTISRYFTPGGVNIHGTGIIPDVEAELDPELATKLTILPEEDNQLQKAVEVLTTGEGMRTPVEAGTVPERVLTDGQPVCTDSGHMEVKVDEINDILLEVMEDSDYSIVYQMDQALEETGENGKVYRSHMIQYALSKDGTITGYDMIMLDVDKGTGDLHYFNIQLEDQSVAEEITRRFLKVAAAASGLSFEYEDWINIKRQMETLEEGDSFSIETDYFLGQVGKIQGMFMIFFFPAE